MMQKIQKFGGAMFTPVLLFAFAGISVGIGTLFTTQAIMGGLAAPTSMWYKCWNVFLQGGWTVFNQLPLLFAVSLPIGMAKKQNARCCMEALVLYMTFHYFVNTILTQWGGVFGVNMNAEVGGTSGLAMIASIKTLDMGMVGALAVSGIVIYLHNRFFDTELPEWLGSFSGSTFVFMIGFFVMIPVAVLACAFWPKVQLGITAFQGFVKSAGAIGIFVFNFLERALIPFGLHHLLYSPFYYDNVVVPGGLYAYWAKLLPQIAASTASLKSFCPEAGFTASGFAKMFGCLGAALAFYSTAKPEKKKKVFALLLPITLTAIVCGVTEPIEFTFLFVSPILFLIHSLLAGIFFYLLYFFKITCCTAGGIFETLLYNVPAGVAKTGWPWFILLGLVQLVVYFVVFRWFILKFDVKIPGRDDSEDVKLMTKKDYDSKKSASKESLNAQSNDLGKRIYEAVGGIGNMNTIDNCFTRLRIVVNSMDTINEEALKETGSRGLVKRGNEIQIIYGTNVNKFRKALEDYMEANHISLEG